MKGRRIPTPTLSVNPDHSLAEYVMFDLITEPGDYCGPIAFGSDPAVVSVFFLLPIAKDPGVPAAARSVHRVASPPHRFRECADGSLEIRESIGAGLPPYYWHGYLDEGHEWRQV